MKSYEELQAERDALAAQVEALKSAYLNLCGAVNDMNDCEWGTDELETAAAAVFYTMQNGYNIVHADPQHHLREIRAEARRAGWVACVDWMVENSSADLFTDGEADQARDIGAQYADSIRQEKK